MHHTLQFTLFIQCCQCGGFSAQALGMSVEISNEVVVDDEIVSNHHSANNRRSRTQSRSSTRTPSRSRSFTRSRTATRSRTRSRSRDRRRNKRSRSSSRDRRRRRSRTRSISRSRSRDRGRHGRRRSKSRSPMSNRKRHLAPRENPPTSRCLGVFGLSLYTTERDLHQLFSRYGKVDDVQLVYDHPSGRSRGFGFVYFDTVDDAVLARERAAGTEIDGHRIRIDFSITKRPHTPTPGIYMGRTSRRSYRDDYYRGRSPSPYNYRRRSRSYSYSPRR